MYKINLLIKANKKINKSISDNESKTNNKNKINKAIFNNNIKISNIIFLILLYNYNIKP